MVEVDKLEIDEKWQSLRKEKGFLLGEVVRFEGEPHSSLLMKDLSGQQAVGSY